MGDSNEQAYICLVVNDDARSQLVKCCYGDRGNSRFILGVSKEVFGRESSFVKYSEEVFILCEEFGGAALTIISRCLTPKEEDNAKKKRRLEAWELKKNDTELRKDGSRKTCALCKELGHNKRSCP
ncbi:hypothetical protein LR48_Vigan08g101100 [Vigna angularis]|uniref:CCHC-type domain-containing protein n=1 Tax=Phaseolus angularis TaxID=3914 RepID=A0A0L9V669_PHAAN|nr:hypothetical protein LR48_Vigan08g101100 [Vigna angularis]